MKRFISVLMILLLLFPMVLAYADTEEVGFVREVADDEEEVVGVASPAMDMSLEEYYQENETLPPELLEDLELDGPFVPEGIPIADPDDKAIIGTDDRIKVKNNKEYPYSAIGYMMVHASCGCNWTGTAFMVSKRCAMTAAHCLVCVEHGGKADHIDFYFGYRKGGYVYHYKKGTQYWYGTDFGGGGHTYGAYTDWDYAYLIFESKVGNKTGWFGLSAPADPELNAGYYEVCGYRNGDMRKDYTGVAAYNQYQFSHWADTKGGYSGCPVFDEDYYVVGINICETPSTNYARRITGSLISEMRANGAF